MSSGLLALLAFTPILLARVLLIGLAIVTAAAPKGFLIPKRTWDFADSKDWPSEWLGSIEMKLDDMVAKPMSGFRAWVPYVLVGVVLVLSRTVDPIKQAFTSVGVSFSNVLGEAGSNTVSNMMFSQFQFGVAESLGLSTALMVAVQAVGAAAGNMVAIHNVVAASATVGLLGREGQTLRKTVWPTLYYLVMTGSIALLAAYGLGLTDPLLN
jgi:L-lactate permease